MTDDDKRLIELAARAMGRKVKSWNDQTGALVLVLDDHTYFQPLYKNGLTDCDGDCARMEDALYLDVNRRMQGVDVWRAEMPESVFEYYSNHSGDKSAARRRASVRAAAMVGESMNGT